MNSEIAAVTGTGVLTVALLSNSSGTSRKVKVGDDLEGWSVAIVETGRVILQYQNDTVEISVAGKAGSGGMRIVARTSMGQSSPASSGTRLLGSSAPANAISHGAYTTPATGFRFYRPPPPPK